MATLGITVVTTGAKEGAADLDKVAAASARAERAAVGVGQTASAYREAGRGINEFQRNINSATSNVIPFRRAVDEATKAAQQTGYQMRQLGFQVNDIATGLLSGQSPFQVLAQQGGQVYQVLQMGPNGVGGSLQEIKQSITAMITPTRLAAAGIVGIGLAAVAATVSWKNFALQLDDLAHIAGTTSSEMAKLQAAASFKGIGGDDFASGIKAFASGIYDARAGAGELAKLLRANGQTVGDTATTLGRVADLIKNSGDDQQRLQVLQQAGIPATMEWVRLLSQGSEGLKQAKEQATAFGGAANDQMISKAREFDEAWNKAWTNFGLQAKNAVVGIATLLDSISEAGNKLIAKIASGGLAEIGSNLLKTGRGTPLSGDVNALYGGFLGGNTGSTVDPRQQEQLLRLEQQRIQTLGALATVEQRVRLEEIAIAQARANGVNISGKEEAALLRLAAANARNADLQAKMSGLGSAATMTEQYAAQLSNLVVLLDAGKLSQDEFNRAVEGLKLDRQIDLLQSKISALGTFATDADKFALAQARLAQQLAQGKITQETFNAALLQANPIFKTLTDAATEFTAALVQGLARGDDLAKVLQASLQNLGHQLIQIGSQNLMGQLFGSAASAGGGAIGGGLTSMLGLGAAAAGPVGSGLALLAGTAISFFSQSKQKADQAAQAAAQAAQQLAQAQQQWASMAGQVSSWMAEWTTGFAGQLSRAIESARGQMQQFANAANQAHDPAGVAAVQAAFNTGVTRSIQEAIVELQNYGAEQSEVAKQIEDVNNKSTDLKNVLVEWGVAAADAAHIVDTQLNAALERLRNNFLDDLVRKVNDLADGAWINQLTDLVNEVAQLRTDAAALGIQTGLIDEYFVRAAQKVIDENQLVGSAFDAVAATLGPLGAGLHEFSAAAEEAAQALKRSAQEIANTIQSYQDQLFIAQQDTQTLAGQLAVFDLQAQRAREQEIAAGGEALAALEALQAQQRLNIINDYNQRIAEEQQRALEQQLEAQRRAAEEAQRVWDEAAKFLQNATQNIQNWISSFLGGSQSPLSPLARLSSAQSTFSTQYSAAIGGNRDALQGITGNAQTLIEAIKGAYGSTSAGQTLINQAISQLQSLPSQLSPEQFIVDNLTPAINDVTAGVDAQTSAMQTLFADLQAAVNSGNASAIAAALLPVFNSIDTNTDNALTFAEMQSALGATYSTGTLRSIFTELDGNGNGILEKSEVIKTATQTTGTNTGSTSTNTANMPQMANNISTINGYSLTTSQNTGNIVTAMGGFSGSNYLATSVTNLSAIISALGSSGVIPQKLGDAGIQNSLIGEAERIRSNLYEQNLNWGDGWAPSGATYIAAGAQIQPYATGGYVYGPSHANGGRIIEVEGGEYIVNKRDTARFRSQLDGMNYRHQSPANDNGDMRELIARIDRLERRLVAATIGGAQMVSDRVGEVADEQSELNKRLGRSQARRLA